MSRQIIFAAVLSMVFCLAIYSLGRRRRLSFRYTVGWLALGSLGALAGALIPLVDRVGEWLSLAPAAVLAIAAIVLLLILCVQLSISISGTQEQVRRLSEEIALLSISPDESSNQSDN